MDLMAAAAGLGAACRSEDAVRAIPESQRSGVIRAGEGTHQAPLRHFDGAHSKVDRRLVERAQVWPLAHCQEVWKDQQDFATCRRSGSALARPEEDEARSASPAEAERGRKFRVCQGERIALYEVCSCRCQRRLCIMQQVTSSSVHRESTDRREPKICKRVNANKVVRP